MCLFVVRFVVLIIEHAVVLWIHSQLFLVPYSMLHFSATNGYVILERMFWRRTMSTRDL